jgi:hypothetical protein
MNDQLEEEEELYLTKEKKRERCPSIRKKKRTNSNVDGRR